MAEDYRRLASALGLVPESEEVMVHHLRHEIFERTVSMDIAQLAAEVARELGEGWSVDRQWDANGRMLDHTDGRRLHICTASWPGNLAGRVIVSGDLPYRPGQYIEPGSRTEITVAKERGAAVIAREINRRLMPGYTEVLAKLRGRNAAEDAAYECQAALAAKVRAIFGLAEPELTDWQLEHVKRQGQTVSLRQFGHGSVNPTYDGTSAKLEVTLPADQLVQVLELLTTFSS